MIRQKQEDVCDRNELIPMITPKGVREENGCVEMCGFSF